MARLLIIEDEDIIRKSMRRLLERNGYEVSDAPSLETASAAHRLADFDLVITDLRLPGESGTAAIPLAEGTPVIIMTSYASVRSAVDAMKQGAIDYIAKPFDHEEMLLTVQRALKEHRLQRQNAALKADLGRDFPIGGMIGQSAGMQQVFRCIEKVAPTDTSVLIMGESGTGKELVARALHEQSPRRDGPMIAVNCAAIPDALIEAEIFGHDEGVFAGAGGARAGLVEAADGGTLFLDEIGELPLAAQARLLRVLQGAEIRRVGSAQSRRVDVRLIVATHRDLDAMVADGSFREDLFFRINVMPIRLPPLRERGEDITLLAHALLEKSAQQLHRPKLRLSAAALSAIRHYHWPGNVRELENAIERAAILCDGEIIDADLLSLSANNAPAATGTAMDLSLEDYFREFVLAHQDRLTETELAKRLGISRKSLWEKRQRLGIPRDHTGRVQVKNLPQ